jgi:AAA15 family ATPase/GTPase
MSNFIKTLEIKNFKSIKHLQPLDCKRVNVIIGKPNVGKSNILEALSLLGSTYSMDKKFMSEFIRYEDVTNLFYDNDITNPIHIKTDNLNCSLFSFDFSHQFYYLLGKEWVKLFENSSNWSDLSNIGDDILKKLNNEIWAFKQIQFEGESSNASGRGMSNNSPNPFKTYIFNDKVKFDQNSNGYLLPPYGKNLYVTLKKEEALIEQISKIFEEYGLKFLFVPKTKEFKVEKIIDRVAFEYPYSSTADTLRRLLFHLTAIESNKDSILILEEPESHSFPGYIWQLANRIAIDDDNQYFIATHSPYILETLMQELGDDDLNIWITYFEHYETKVHPLSKNELQEMYDLGGDIFFNMDKFEKSKAV